MSLRRLNPFRLKIDGIDVTEIETPKRDSLKIGLTLIAPGVVPYYEEQLTRREAGYKLSEWYALHPRERALEVATRRMSNKLTAIQADSQRKK